MSIKGKICMLIGAGSGLCTLWYCYPFTGTLLQCCMKVGSSVVCFVFTGGNAMLHCFLNVQ